MYGVLCIGMAGLASLMGGILQVELIWIVSFQQNENDKRCFCLLLLPCMYICSTCSSSTPGIHCAAWAIYMLLYVGSHHNIWGHWRSITWSVYNCYRLSICQLQSKSELAASSVYSDFRNQKKLLPCVSMNYPEDNNLTSAHCELYKDKRVFVLFLGSLVRPCVRISCVSVGGYRSPDIPSPSCADTASVAEHRWL